MGRHDTSTDLTDDDMAVPDTQMRIGARLQSFASYADDPAHYCGQILPVAIHRLSRRQVITESVPDLRIGSIVRLRIPMLGWRHLQVRWISDGVARCDFLLPLLPYELRAVLEQIRPDRKLPPPRRGPTGLPATPRAAAARSGPPRRALSPLSRPIDHAGQILADAWTRLLAGLGPQTRGHTLATT
jgi:hypothetical protein